MATGGTLFGEDLAMKVKEQNSQTPALVGRAPAGADAATVVTTAGHVDAIADNANAAAPTTASAGRVDEDSVDAPRFAPLREALSENKKRETLLKIEAQVEAFLADPK